MKEAKPKQVPILNAKYTYVSAKRYAEISGKHVMTIYAMLRAGQIEGAVQFGRGWKIPVKEN